MPPRLGLQLQVPVAEPEETAAPPEGSSNLLSNSWGLGDSGSLVKNSLKIGYGGTQRLNEQGGTDSDSAYNICEQDLKTLGAKLGAGASGEVFKALLVRENALVAVKKINGLDKEKRKQMMNDVKALIDARDSVPGLIQFYGAYLSKEREGQVCICLEYMNGGSLQDIVQKVGKIPEPVLSYITGIVLQGLNYLHRSKHMVHRDIKPANILMNIHGEPKITDFGISAFVDNTLAQCATFKGTVTYMSPERIHAEKYSFPGDIWSLGMMLIELATGKYPYDAAVGPVQLMIHICESEVPLPPAPEHSDELRDFITKCMAKKPNDRWTAEQLLSHPFISKHAGQRIDMAGFMANVVDPANSLDEISTLFAMSYYSILSNGTGYIDNLFPLYIESSIVKYEEHSYEGRVAIAEHLKQVAQIDSTFGSTLYEVQEIDVQPLYISQPGRIEFGDSNSALVHVKGRRLASLGPNIQAQPFTEVFVISRNARGEYYVANQMFRPRK